MKQAMLDTQRMPNGRFRTHIFLDGKHHYGESDSLGGSLIELGIYLKGLTEPNDMQTLMNVVLENKP